MFEKSLYDLIRGMRYHKGKEQEYIQESLRECRKEIKSPDMNLKAIALLKLTYLEMFGHDMSWASFNVLEVMSSQQYAQKKVGYLAAIQSFRSDTEVLMLAENLLKKDVSSADPLIINLPLAAVPHVINPSMANSLLSDLLPRLSHSQPAIRKKTIVTLYRLALVYPETLRPAWPKIKERLQDENEDPSVTSAIVNVVCELGWRRPQDFLALAPRLFDLLVAGGNNWMAIKIIKLFATLTPLEPRLIKKLLPPLTSLIKTTPAMSLLYECIHGIIEGGILESVEGTADGEEVAKLCVGKLRSMLVVEDDPNLRYVALLAFQKIVVSHAYLVSLHQDVILDCMDDGDISIRMRALDLVVGMVNPDNLHTIVEKILIQLNQSPFTTTGDKASNVRADHHSVEPHVDEDGEDAGETLRNHEVRSKKAPSIPLEYRIDMLKAILKVCSQDTYSNITDFEWYIEVLVQLVRSCPTVTSTSTSQAPNENSDIAAAIGQELQNVAVRIKALRSEATAAAQSFVLIDKRKDLFPPFGNGGQGVLEASIWLVGEYASLLTNPEGVLSSSLDSSALHLPIPILATSIHAALKVFSALCSDNSRSYSPQRRTHLTLLTARLIHFLEPLVTHTSLEIQERAVEYLELLKLVSEAATGHSVSYDDDFQEPPLLLTQAVPSLFTGMELKPVAPGAQRKVPPPEGLDLDQPINPNLQSILQSSDYDDTLNLTSDDFEAFYHKRSTTSAAEQQSSLTAAERLDASSRAEESSYQQSSHLDNVSNLAQRRAEREERYKDDPFYIGGEDNRLNNIIKTTDGDDIDIDSIPVMDLQLESRPSSRNQPHQRSQSTGRDTSLRKVAARRKIEIVADETLGDDMSQISSSAPTTGPSILSNAAAKNRKNLLGFDSSGLGSLSLEDKGPSSLDIYQKEEEEKALREVERLRLEMQRASERIMAREDSSSLVVKKKKKKKIGKEEGGGVGEILEAEQGEGAGVVVRKKKKKKVAIGDEDAGGVPEMAEAVAPKPKKKKRREVNLMGPGEEA